MFESRPDTASKLKTVPSAAISGALLKQNFRWNKKIKLYSLFNLKNKIFNVVFKLWKIKQQTRTLIRCLNTVAIFTSPLILICRRFCLS